MSRPIVLTLLLFCILIAFTLQIKAQDLSQTVGIWYLEERFILSDQNDDALLDRSEMEAYPSEFMYYLADQNYALCDRNSDGFLSFNEMNQRTSTEFTYRTQMEKRELRKLMNRFPGLAEADREYLSKMPELTQLLFGNCVWLEQNRELSEEVYNDPAWAAEHSLAIMSLHHNLLWMASNPTDARHLYEDRTMTGLLPELTRWRSNHMKFMRKHPKLEPMYKLWNRLTIVRPE